MIKIAITGGIGSGKSYVSSIFESLNIPIYNADENSKKIVSKNLELRAKLIDVVGEECYKDGMLNKKLLANFIFSSNDNRLLINSIIHPYVYRDFLRWCDEHADCEIAGMESAILYESGFNEYVDKVVMVYAPLDVRIERAMNRDNASREAIVSRVSAQMDDSTKCALSDYIIDNGGEKELLPQIYNIIQQLKKNLNSNNL